MIFIAWFKSWLNHWFKSNDLNQSTLLLGRAVCMLHGKVICTKIITHSWHIRHAAIDQTSVKKSFHSFQSNGQKNVK